jgi:hypothetical protein
MIADDAGFCVRVPSEFEGVSRRDVLDVGAYVGALVKGRDRGVLPRTNVGRCRDLLTPTQGQGGDLPRDTPSLAFRRGRLMTVVDRQNNHGLSPNQTLIQTRNRSRIGD